MDSAEDDSWLPRAVRGRQRRRARRNWSSGDDIGPQPRSAGLRGRHLRSQKRHIRITSQYGQINDADSSHVVDMASQKRRSLLPVRPQLHRTVRLSARQVRRSAASHSHSGSFYAGSDARLTPEQEPSDNSRPAWLLEAGVKWPLHLRRISVYLDHSQIPPRLLLDTAMANTIRTVGADHSNELLTMMMDGCHSISVSPAAMNELVKWTSLPLTKRLEHYASTRPKRDLLRTAMKNPTHCMDIYTYLTEHYQCQLDPDTYNSLLERAIIASATVPFTRRGRFGDDLDPTAQAHFKKLCDILLFKYAGAPIYASTVASAIQAEIRGRPSYKDPEPWPAVRLLLARCTEEQDTTILLQKALKDSSLTTVRLLLEKFPNASISKAGLLEYFRRDRRGSRRFRHTEDADQEPPTEDEIEIHDQMVRRWKGRPLAEVIFLNCHDYNEGPAVLRKLLAFNTSVDFSDLMARFLVRTFSAKDLRQGLTFEDEDCNRINLKAAMEEQVALNRRRDQTVIRYIAMRIPCDQLSDDVIELAAQATAPSLFSKIMSRCPAQELPETVLLSAMRSSYPAVRKIKLLLHRLPLGRPSFSADFLPALISMNHPDTLRILKILQVNYGVYTNDSSIVAAWRTDDANGLVRQLVKDKSFNVTNSTISAILQEQQGSYSNPRLLKYLFKHSNSVIIGSDLMTAALCDRSYCRILLVEHGAPWKLCLTETNLLGLFAAKQHKGYSVSDLYDLDRCLDLFMQAGGRIAVTEKLLEALGKHKPTLALKLWQHQTAIDFYSMLKFVFGDGHRYYGNSDLLDLWLKYGPEMFDTQILQTFDRLAESTNSHRYPRYSPFWDALLDLIRNGERSKFEEVYARLGGFQITHATIERFCAQVIVHAQPRARLDDASRNTEPSSIFTYIEHWFGPITLGLDFFQALKDIPPTLSSIDVAESPLMNWQALLDAPIEIEWCPLAEEVMFMNEPYEMGIKVMTMLGIEPTFAEDVVLAAISSKSALLKLEYMWQHKENMLVTVPMIEAAIRTTVVEVVDFLLARSDLDCITEDVMVMAMRGVEPGEKEDSPYFHGRASRSRIVEFLIVQSGSVSPLSLSSLELAVNNLHESLAERLLISSTRHISKTILMAMLKNEWQSERILHILRRSNGGIEHMDDREVVEALVKTEDGQSFLLFAKPNDNNVQALIEEERFKSCLMRSNSRDWAVFDYPNRLSEMHLDDTALAHIWEESTRYTFSHKQALFHILDSGATGRIGAQTFATFWNTCMDRKYGRFREKRSLPRVIGQLPPLPVDINEGVISSAKHGFDGRTALDYVLGPDHEIIIHQGALQECARLREELWLARLLQRLTVEELANLNAEALLDAAIQGGNHSIIELCRVLAGKQSPTQPIQRTVKSILGRERHTKRQRLRRGRPKIASPLRRAFFRFYKLLRTKPHSRATDSTHLPRHLYKTAERRILKHINRGISGLKAPTQPSPQEELSDQQSDDGSRSGLRRATSTLQTPEVRLIKYEEPGPGDLSMTLDGLDARSSDSSEDDSPGLQEDRYRWEPEPSGLTGENIQDTREQVMRAETW